MRKINKHYRNDIELIKIKRDDYNEAIVYFCIILMLIICLITFFVVINKNQNTKHTNYYSRRIL